MDSIEQTGLIAAAAAVGGGIITWIAKAVAARFVSTKYELEDERWKKLLESQDNIQKDIKEVTIQISGLVTKDEVKEAKLINIEKDISEIQGQQKKTQEEINKIQIQIAKVK